MYKLIKDFITSNHSSVSNKKPRDPFVVHPPEVLLYKHQQFIEEVRLCTAIPRNDWETLYLPMFDNVARYVQNLPASAAHHHSGIGGLLEHSLEIAMYSARVTRGVTFTTNGQEVQVGELAQVYIYAVVSGALIHDLGKLITDLDVLVEIEGKQIKWNPVLGPMPIGAKYKFSMNHDSQRARHDHEHASPLLARAIIPSKGLRWLSELNTNLYRMWLSTISGHGKSFGAEVYDAIHLGDIQSAKKSMQSGALGQRAVSAQSGKHQQSITIDTNVPDSVNDISQAPTASGDRYFHEPFITYWSDLILSNSVKLNCPGAYAWITDSHIFLISPKAINNAVEHIKALGQIPAKQTDLQVLSRLKEHNAIECLDQDNPSHTRMNMKVFDPSNNWKKPLGLTAVRRSLIDPDSQLPTFKGILTTQQNDTVIYDGIQKQTPTQESGDKEQLERSRNEEGTAKVSPLEQSIVEKDDIGSVVADELKDLPQGKSSYFDPDNSYNQSCVEDFQDFVNPNIADIDSDPDFSDYEAYSRMGIDDSVVSEQPETSNLSNEPHSPMLSERVAKLVPKQQSTLADPLENQTKKVSLVSILTTPKENSDVALSTSLTDDEISGEVGSGKDFWWWLQEQSSKKAFEMNKANAPVHIILSSGQRCAFLASPIIFMDYCRAKNLGTSNSSITQVQNSFFKLSNHIPNTQGNIHRVSVNRVKKRAMKRPLSGVLLTPDATKELFDEQYSDLRLNQWFEL
ncbi:MobH family relaxase [Vibrio lentus]|uniref:MobH family relaxase n=1 Tax=Vibrio splendidus TaxID=29497 RepID=UPI000C84143F|nr:MobH family relaxase [Vibrio splendidus]PMG17872.1 hypothetical protein BCU98_00635 [Vibrio splendidus]